MFAQAWPLCASVCMWERERERVRAGAGGSGLPIYLFEASILIREEGRNLSCKFFFFFRSLLNLFQHCFCSMFWSLEAHGSLACWPRIDPMPPALEGDVPATGPPQGSPFGRYFKCNEFTGKAWGGGGWWMEEGCEWKRVNSPDRPALAPQTWACAHITWRRRSGAGPEAVRFWPVVPVRPVWGPFGK